VWATTQFTSTALTGARVGVRAEVLKAGRRTSQVQVTATGEDGEVVFVSLGAGGVAKPDGLSGTPEHMPTVTPPDEGRPAFAPSGARAEVGWHLACELRTAAVLDHSDQAAGRICLWARMLDDDIWTAARLAFVADMVPVSVARGSGVYGAGTSLDNTLRAGFLDDVDGWALIDLRPHLAAGGYGHGTVHLWTPDGVLLATGSQTASMIVFESDPFTRFPG
jgi:acyl-CoA thioesterase